MMNAGRFIHQQVMQLKWHFLVCFGLVMALPLEEAFVNLKEGTGFYSSYTTALILFWTPLLAALLACANVQADLEPRREGFWRSKPLNISGFMAGKYAIGLLLAILIFACPLLFSWISLVYVGETVEYSLGYVVGLLLVLLMTYSICFFVNVLIRKTAQAWLVGVAVTLLILLLGYVVPLNIKDVPDVFLIKSAMLLGLVLTLGSSVIAIVGSILAVKHHWRVHTHLRSLLWGGVGLVFVLALLLSRQIANIKVVKEINLSDQMAIAPDPILEINGKYFIGAEGECYQVLISNGSIELQPQSMFRQGQNNSMEPYEVPTEWKNFFSRGWILGRDRRSSYSTFHRVGSIDYSFYLENYYSEKMVVEDDGWEKKVNHLERTYLHCDRWDENVRVPLSYLNLTEHAEQLEGHWRHTYLCLIDEKAVVVMGKCCLVVDISNPASMTVIEHKQLRREVWRWGDDLFELFPLESIDPSVRIPLSIEMGSWGANLYHSHEGHLGYILSYDNAVSRYDIEVDDGLIRGYLRDERAFSLLEQHGGNWFRRRWLQDGQLYLQAEHRIMVFDVSGPRIRKLGHYERYAHSIEDMKVLDNGDILLLSRSEEGPGSQDYQDQFYLQLLKNPK